MVQDFYDFRSEVGFWGDNPEDLKEINPLELKDAFSHLDPALEFKK